MVVAQPAEDTAKEPENEPMIRAVIPEAGTCRPLLVMCVHACVYVCV